MATIDRNDVASLIEEGFSTDFLNSAADTSAVLRAFPTRSMGTKTERLPVLASLPEAKFVNEWSDSGGAEQPGATKPTSKLTWGSKTLNAEEIAVIIPVHENLIADSSVDILGEITRQGGAAIARKLDAAVLHGADKPETWTSNDLAAAAVAAGQVTTEDSVEDLLDALYTIEGEMADNGFEDLTVVARRSLSSRLKNQRDANGAFLGAGDVLSDFSPVFAKNFGTDHTAFAVDKASVLIGVRQDITVKILDQATVNGINLAETDQIGVRFVARYAYVLKDDKAVYAIDPAAEPAG